MIILIYLKVKLNKKQIIVGIYSISVHFYEICVLFVRFLYFVHIQ